MSKLSIGLLLCLFLLSSCSKKIVGFLRSTPSEIVQIDEFEFDYLVLKSKVELMDDETKKNENATIHVRMKKDSLIWTNITGTLGIQGMRALFTQDSVKIINRVEKTYSSISYKDFSKQFGVNLNFQNVQSIILGNLLRPQDDEDQIEKLESQYLIKQAYGSLTVENYIGVNTSKLEKVVITEQPLPNAVNILYEDFRLVNEQAFPFLGIIDLFYENDGMQIQSKFRIEHQKAEIPEKPLKFPFNIPNKYGRN